MAVDAVVCYFILSMYSRGVNDTIATATDLSII